MSEIEVNETNKRICKICHLPFTPNNGKQRVCSNKECKKVNRKRTERTPSKKWPEKSIIEALRRYHSEFPDGNSKHYQTLAREDLPSFRVILKQYGSWAVAVREIGNTPPRMRSDKENLSLFKQSIMTSIMTLCRVPTASEYTRLKLSPSVTTLSRMGLTYSEALTKIGFGERSKIGTQKLKGDWKGWSITDSVLVSPTGREFKPDDIEPETYSQTELANALGVTRAAIQDRIRRGTLPPFDEGKTWHRDTIKHVIQSK